MHLHLLVLSLFLSGTKDNPRLRIYVSWKFNFLLDLLTNWYSVGSRFPWIVYSFILTFAGFIFIYLDIIVLSIVVLRSCVSLFYLLVQKKYSFMASTVFCLVNTRQKTVEGIFVLDLSLVWLQLFLFLFHTKLLLCGWLPKTAVHFHGRSFRKMWLLWLFSEVRAMKGLGRCDCSDCSHKWWR